MFQDAPEGQDAEGKEVCSHFIEKTWAAFKITLRQADADG